MNANAIMDNTKYVSGLLSKVFNRKFSRVMSTIEFIRSYLLFPRFGAETSSKPSFGEAFILEKYWFLALSRLISSSRIFVDFRLSPSSVWKMKEKDPINIMQTIVNVVNVISVFWLWFFINKYVMIKINEIKAI